MSARSGVAGTPDALPALPSHFTRQGPLVDPSTAHHSKTGTYAIPLQLFELRMAAGMADAKISDGGRRWMSMDHAPQAMHPDAREPARRSAG